MNEIKKDLNLKKYLLWIDEKKIYIFSILATVLFINVIIFKVKPLIGRKSPEGTILASQSYLDWKKTDFKDLEKLNQLKNLIRKYPSLKPNYEGLVLQNLLITHSFGKEEYNLADSALERTKSELPLYYEYSKAAILISNGQYEEALNKSKELKTKMLNDLTFLEGKELPAGCVLYSFNLLRIALLEGKLNDTSKELVAWQELEDYLSLESQNKINDKIQIATQAIKEIFNENGIELIDYILYRKNKISPIKS